MIWLMSGALWAPKWIYDLLFETANRVLKEFAQRYLGGKIGVTAVLHTWGRPYSTPFTCIAG